MKNFFRNNGLSLVLISIFAVTWVGQFFAGAATWNEELLSHHAQALSLSQYFLSGHFWQATGENWESEFLQMALYVVLTSCLFQKGSPESNDPDHPDEELTTKKTSPWPVRKGGLFLQLYQNSLSSFFFVCFIASVLIHACGGWRAVNDENRLHNESTFSLVEYVTGSRFWFESLQNWQSEFLSLAAMVFVSVYLRQKAVHNRSKWPPLSRITSSSNFADF